MQSLTTPDMSIGETAKLTLINDLPDEVLQQVLYFLSPPDTLVNIQRLSKRFDRLSCQPLLWRHHCRVHFKYWDSKHRIKQKWRGSAVDVDWKSLYVYRRQVDAQTTELLNGILERQTDRAVKSTRIAEFGYDAKDTLLRHCHVSEAAEDVLARRYATHFPSCPQFLTIVKVLCKRRP